MTAPDEERLANLLDVCLALVHAGEDPEAVLQQYPAEAEELRPLLEAAQMAELPAQMALPALSARVASKNKFLDAAARESSRGQGWFWLLRPLRTAGLALLAALFLFSTLAVGGNLVSAQALPGEALYPVKRVIERAEYWLAASPASRLALEERLDSRRADEVQRLIGQGKEQDVRFAGFLSGQAGDWQVAGIPIGLADGQEKRLPTLTGTYVEVIGRTQAAAVAVQNLQLRIFHLDGPIQAVDDDQWQVDGVTVRLDPATRLRGQPVLGATAQITAIRVERDSLLALLIWVRGSGQNTQPAPVARPTRENTPTREENRLETLEPAEEETVTETVEPSRKPDATRSDDSGLSGKSTQDPPRPQDDSGGSGGGGSDDGGGSGGGKGSKK